MGLGHVELAESREWLVTNGLGSYASGTVSDILTRRYHGLLVAALEPPLGRRVLFAKLDTAATYHATTYDLGANRWRDDSIAPRGFEHLIRFRLDGTIPTWTYAIENAVLERRVWMERGADTTYIRYTLVDADAPVTLALKAFANDRDYHSLTHAYDATGIEGLTSDRTRARIRLNAGGASWTLGVDCGTIDPVGVWYYGFLLARERDRGLDYAEDHFYIATINATLSPGDSLTVVASLDRIDDLDGHEALARARESDVNTLADFYQANTHHSDAPRWVQQLALAADQFIVSRDVAGNPGKTVIAGYHWFGDWGRDTMIALPGLTLTCGRAPIARSILETFSQYLSQGMLPNRFPDAGTPSPEYNTVDATLWYVEAIRAYVEATNDVSLVQSTYDSLVELVEWHVRGTRYGIAMADDGLIRAGEAGVQLTWMDAKVGDWVVTPRIGKPVEINALWYNALRAIDAFAQMIGRDSSRVRELASRTRASFGRFWNESNGYLYDVLDGPNGNEDAIRPNAVIAISLPFRALDQTKERLVIDRAAQMLLTSNGLRSLAPRDAAYVGTYGGGVTRRDGAYHQGTAWPWLIGPFVRAFMNAYGKAEPMQHQLEFFSERLWEYGMGTLAEIADGDAPHDARGCIAQAWSVAEILRAWSELQGAKR